MRGPDRPIGRRSRVRSRTFSAMPKRPKTFAAKHDRMIVQGYQVLGPALGSHG